ncbi:MAG TPA: tetratricopeptide repeat protein [Vicinamibacteria bacterium]|nr:tetratricopeptide repeat protein [Vicinamibacteria bacterium]
MNILPRALAVLLLPALTLTACGQVQAKAAFKDANKNYREENFKQAIPGYEKAVSINPNFAEAWFYLGSSHQALYRPGKDDPENKKRLEDAINAYRKSLEVNPAQTPNQKTVKQNTLAALTSIYSDDPFKNYDEAIKYANQLVQENPSDTRNLFAMANLYEKFEKVDEAERTYKQVYDANPNDPKACGALGAFYNKPLWKDEQGAARSRFNDAIQVLEKCAAINPNDAGGWQKVATFYWDKAYRDPLLTDEEKNQYADRGMAAVDKALELKPDYFEAVIYKGLLYRVKAAATPDARAKQEYLDKAVALSKQGQELRKQAEQAAAAAAAAATPAPES